MCLGYTAKSRDCQYCVIVIALCPSYCDIVLFLFVLLLFAGLLVAKTGLRCGPRALLDPSPKQGITKALWSIQRKGILCFAIVIVIVVVIVIVRELPKHFGRFREKGFSVLQFLGF